ncbi:uncharacterized protein LOC132457879 [Gadus macrocephalus]|uniref:uncharacterized protein LOC132457879 n=1 Tax=Gadus macrocephalus TaxID=80720 RepID=UPI0028CB6604|nr:uncharacterized protein LOC132457879 [Gadus macrocephalus]
MAFCKVITVTSYLLLVSYGIGLAQKHTIPECKPSLKEQQEAGDIDSSDVEDYLKLATYGMYESVIKNRAFSKGKGNPGHKGYVQADHIPPIDSLKKAELGGLKIINPALYDMVMSLEKDPEGMKLFTLQVATHHHRAALSTGRSKESEAVRAVLTCKIARGEVVPMLKQAMMIAHPFVSQSMRGIQRSFPGEKCSLSDDRTTKIYEKGFLGLINFNYEAKVITAEERDKLKDYVSQHYALGGNFDKDSIEYQEILETVKRSLQRRKGIKRNKNKQGFPGPLENSL